MTVSAEAWNRKAGPNDRDGPRIVRICHGASRCPRLASIDIFRGLTMTVMIFVNELAGVRDCPGGITT